MSDAVKDARIYMHHYVNRVDIEVAQNWSFKAKDTMVTIKYSKGTRLPLNGAVLDMVMRDENPLHVLMIARRYRRIEAEEQLYIVRNIIQMFPLDPNNPIVNSHGWWYARNPVTKERFRVDLDPNAFNSLQFWVEGTPMEKITFPKGDQVVHIYHYLQDRGIWIYGDDWFDEGLLIDIEKPGVEEQEAVQQGAVK